MDIRALLREHLPSEIGEPRPLAGGEFSRAYAFTASGREYVLRVNDFAHAAEAFAKDDRAARLYRSTELPIPRVVARGDWQGTQFAISERADGRRVMELDDAARLALLPRLLDTLDAIGHADVAGSTGHGPWDADGQGQFPSWHTFLAHVIENRTDGYYQDWHAMFESTFLERDVYETVYRRMLELVAHAPEERALIHNDFHFDNLLTDRAQVTGVVDWANACYGDRVYDAAWVGWVFAKDYAIDAATPLRERHGHLPGYDLRVAGYTLHVGLDDLRFFARTGRPAQYQWARERLLELAYQ